MSDLPQTPLADFYTAQGATLGEYHGATVPAKFSDPVAEHDAVRQASGVFDISFRAKFAVTGRDAAKFLHRILSQDIKRLAPGQGAYAALLNAQGHIVADFNIYCAEDRYLIDIDADLREKAEQAIGRYIIGDRVSIEPAPSFAFSFQGPAARALLGKTLHVDLPLLQEFDHFAANYAGFPIRVVRLSSTGEEGYEVWVGGKGMAGVWGAACGQAPTYAMLPCGTAALEMLRIEAGIPRYGQELDEDTLPNEAELFNAVSFTKGCYVGQEIVERARSRGHVNWKLVGLTVHSPTPPAAGEKLLQEGKAVGEITSACASPSLAQTLALGYARHEVAEPGTKLALASGPAAEVAPLPFYHRPKPNGSHGQSAF